MTLNGEYFTIIYQLNRPRYVYAKFLFPSSTYICRIYCIINRVSTRGYITSVNRNSEFNQNNIIGNLGIINVFHMYMRKIFTKKNDGNIQVETVSTKSCHVPLTSYFTVSTKSFHVQLTSYFTMSTKSCHVPLTSYFTVSTKSCSINFLRYSVNKVMSCSINFLL